MLDAALCSPPPPKKQTNNNPKNQPNPKTNKKSFGTEFTKAVEMKQVAEQDAERARFVVAKAEQERNAAVIRAEGESEAAKLISDATRAVGGGLIELRRIEAARDIAETMAKGGNVVYLPGGANGGGNNLLLGINPGGR